MINNEKGYSLAEMAVVAGLTSLIAAGTAFQMFSIKKEFSAVTKRIDDNLDKITSNMLIFREIKNSSPSFNNISLRDDNGQLFYDYFSDVSAKDIPEAKRTRIFTIDKYNKNVFYLISSTGEERSLYNPIDAYMVTEPPFDQSKPGTILFKGVNNNKRMNKLFPDSWKTGKLFIFTSPTEMRDTTKSKIDFSKPSREMSYLGFVNYANSDLERLSFNLFNYTHPADPSVQLTSMDTYLKRLPALGGAAPMVTVEPVRLLRFYIADSGRKYQSMNIFGLYYSMYENGKWGEAQLVSSYVDKVEFHRELVTMPIVGVKIYEDKKIKDVMNGGTK